MVNTSSFEYSESRWGDLFKHLQKKGFDVYPPAVKAGECKTPYVVIKLNGDGDIAGTSSTRDYYSVMVYVPKLAYSTLEPLVQKIKKAMKELDPLFKLTNVQPSFYDDTVKAHMVSVEYYNNKMRLRSYDVERSEDNGGTGNEEQS